METVVPSSSLTAGVLIANRFQLVRLLGQGGMGSVWVAWHTTLNIEIAIKFIDAALGARDEVLSRFAQEARTAAKIKSPHVVSIIDYGSDDWRRPYIAMELLQGETLADRLERDVQLPLRDVAQIVNQACKGLSRAHAAGVTHRDLKPENVFLCEDDEGYLVKLLDFGIARASSPIGEISHKTASGALVGTPAYMSPEQALCKKEIDFKSDLYSLAVVAFRCLTGHLPFEPEGLGELIVAIGTREPPPAASFRKDVPEAVEAWLRRAFQKDPANRFASAKEMSAALSTACDPAHITSPGLDETLLALPAAKPSHGEHISNVSPMASTALSATQPKNGSLVGSVRPADEAVSLPTANIKPWLFAGVGLAILVALGVVVVPRLGAHQDAARSGLAQSVDLTRTTPSARPGGGSDFNRWIAVAAAVRPDEVLLGVGSDKTARTTRGFRPQRHIHPPAKPYEIQQHEVTWNEVAPFLKAHPMAALAAAPAEGTLPVTGVRWETAVLYCESLAPGLATLPTEEEWEFAARGTERRPFAWGSSPLDLKSTHAYRGKHAEVVPAMTSSQDRTPGSPERAVYDMMGNAVEWTLDVYREDLAGQDEGWAQADGLTYRTLRGLPLHEPAPASLASVFEGAAYRDALCASGNCPKQADEELRYVGFRCVRHAP